ncbi:hypothetical protein D3C87_823300 [compost metagenome]
MFINQVGLGVLVACMTVDAAMTNERRLERPRIKRVPLRERVLSGCMFGPTSWECSGRGVVGYGIDVVAAYRNWRRRLADKKRHGIVMARAKSRQEEAVAQGRAYIKPDGRIKYRAWKFWKKEA